MEGGANGPALWQAPVGQRETRSAANFVSQPLTPAPSAQADWSYRGSLIPLVFPYDSVFNCIQTLVDYV